MPKSPTPVVATFEVFEMNSHEFWWYLKDADGKIVDSWNAELRYDEEAERMIGSRAFRTDELARAWFAEAHPTATDFHSYAKDA